MKIVEKIFVAMVVAAMEIATSVASAAAPLHPVTSGGTPLPPVDGPQGSDDFDATTLDPMWQWNHVPEDGAWSLSERKGWMRIRGRAGRPFFKTPNVLCQRVLQREDGASVSVKVDGARLRDGEAAGLALFNGGRNYAIDGIVREDGKLKRFFEKDGERTILGDVKGTVATLAWEVKGAACTSATEKMAEIRGANYRGINSGLYSTGLADFDDFEMEYSK